MSVKSRKLILIIVAISFVISCARNIDTSRGIDEGGNGTNVETFNDLITSVVGGVIVNEEEGGIVSSSKIYRGDKLVATFNHIYDENGNLVESNNYTNRLYKSTERELGENEDKEYDGKGEEKEYNDEGKEYEDKDGEKENDKTTDKDREYEGDEAIDTKENEGGEGLLGQLREKKGSVYESKFIWLKNKLGAEYITKLRGREIREKIEITKKDGKISGIVVKDKNDNLKFKFRIKNGEGQKEVEVEDHNSNQLTKVITKLDGKVKEVRNYEREQLKDVQISEFKETGEVDKLKYYDKDEEFIKTENNRGEILEDRNSVIVENFIRNTFFQGVEGDWKRAADDRNRFTELAFRTKESGFVAEVKNHYSNASDKLYSSDIVISKGDVLVRKSKVIWTYNAEGKVDGLKFDRIGSEFLGDPNDGYVNHSQNEKDIEKEKEHEEQLFGNIEKDKENIDNGGVDVGVERDVNSGYLIGDKERPIVDMGHEREDEHVSDNIKFHFNKENLVEKSIEVNKEGVEVVRVFKYNIKRRIIYKEVVIGGKKSDEFKYEYHRDLVTLASMTINHYRKGGVVLREVTQFFIDANKVVTKLYENDKLIRWIEKKKLGEREGWVSFEYVFGRDRKERLDKKVYINPNGKVTKVEIYLLNDRGEEYKYKEIELKESDTDKKTREVIFNEKDEPSKEIEYIYDNNSDLDTKIVGDKLKGEECSHKFKQYEKSERGELKEIYESKECTKK